MRLGCYVTIRNMVTKLTHRVAQRPSGRGVVARALSKQGARRAMAARAGGAGTATLGRWSGPVGPVLGSIRVPGGALGCRAAASTDAPSSGSEETYEYQAEVNRLMDLIVNSLYSNKDVFLRELISNASDALDKVRFLSIKDPSVLEGNDDLKIEVKCDPEANTIVIQDTGIGMTKAELLESLGTIARSGTAKFMEAIKQSQDASSGDASLIGQFGVGFYSSFLVADKVRVQTKSRDDDKQYAWESAVGSVSYTVAEDSDGESIGRGTRITLFLKEDTKEYADHMKIRDLIRQYSEFIGFPIQLWTTKSVTKQVVDEEATEKKKKELEEKNESVEDMEPVMKTDYDTVWDWTLQNESKPLWLQRPSEVEKEEYDGFFKTTFKEFMDPLAYNHFNVEGTYEFSGIVYIPGMAPFDMQEMQDARNIRLYVNKVFISDKFDESFLPRYLSFVKGVIDSRDLPLNVSREILQQSRVSRIMRKQLVKRTLDTIKGIKKREDSKDYDTFWEAFGKNLKLGVIEDQENRENLSNLLLFVSSASGEGLTSLEDYVSRMKENQKAIYYIAAESKDIAATSPFVEDLLKRDMEILYLVEPIDEVCVANLAKFKDYDLIDVSKEDLVLDDESEEEKKSSEEAEKEFSDLTSWMKEVLGQKVEKVVVSKRKTDSPCLLVTSQGGWSANMEKIMRAQAMGDNRAMEYMRGKKILEINPNHQIIKSLKGSRDSNASSMVALMYETALLTSGFNIESPRDYATRVFEMIEAASKSGSGDAAEKVEAEVVSEEKGDKDDPWK